MVETIWSEATERGLAVTKEQYALARGGAALFGVLDFARRLDDGEAGFSLGFRSSQDQTLALLGRAGLRVFVCHNLALSGDAFASQHRHTLGLDLRGTVRAGFDRYEQHSVTLTAHVVRLRDTAVSDVRAKEIFYDALTGRVIPSRLLPEIHRNYFEESGERPDCRPRSLWGLYNACTRALRGFGPGNRPRRSGADLRRQGAAGRMPLSMERFRDALQVLNSMKSDGVIEDYAVAGAMAILFWTEPVPTFDLDVLLFLPPSGQGIVSLDAIHRWAETRRYKTDKEHIVVEGVPTQFLPSPSPVADEAIETAATLDYGGVPVRVVKPEYLVALYFRTSSRDSQTSRACRHAPRVARLEPEAPG